ncbi:MAG: VIT1/CCC1 transporter family protein [Phaeodactylibacter sp.]|nr:VIT1/CCC1 transporter family protein [Phaeodactylibacter sp.]
MPFALAAGLSGAAVASSLVTTAGLAVVALFLFGALKSRVMHQPVLAGAFKVVMIGILAAAAAFGIARWVA